MVHRHWLWRRCERSHGGGGAARPCQEGVHGGQRAAGRLRVLGALGCSRMRWRRSWGGRCWPDRISPRFNLALGLSSLRGSHLERVKAVVLDSALARHG